MIKPVLRHTQLKKSIQSNKKKYQRSYIQKKKSDISENMKKYRQQKKIEISKKNKTYLQKNKDKISKGRKQ